MFTTTLSEWIGVIGLGIAILVVILSKIALALMNKDKEDEL